LKGRKGWGKGGKEEEMRQIDSFLFKKFGYYWYFKKYAKW